MNVLAHALLAGNDAALRLGGAMGDFVHGTPDPSLPERVREGIYLHRAIDTFTDSHPEVRAARERMPPPFRRYAGILLDVWFDHLLARDFAAWSETPLEEFSAGIRAELHAAEGLLPDGLKRFLAYMDRHGLPAGYVHIERVAGAFAGISKRLSRANPVADGVEVLQAQSGSLERTFAAFFPDLQAFAEERIARRPR
ncbi:ACP phosphodiesterase [Luteibacter yeojuensis]|uniref:DUF479 domain-containing protein n=1 Tax=Luteibacter yeojuensis TaxID=345309 RepID=A0A7X5TS16_9GAMM|nr:ACP phosphodiesterase [Luteibacter yeojuensis]NID17374.1 DUF479 domain-containing protein [Luteibacter yeojuensis]